jgi:hypothetical protein
MELGKVLPLRPRYVVFMDAINDLGQISKAGSYWAGPLDRALISDPTHNVHNNNFYRVGKLIKNILIPNSWELLKSVFQAHRAITVDEWALYRKKNINIVGVRDRMLQDFSASLKSLIAVSRSWGIEPILMTQFNRVNEADDFSRFVYESMPQTLSWLDFVQLYKEANGIIRDVAHREKVLLIDLDKHIPANKDYMYDPVHLTQKGSEMVASHVANSLVINRSSDFVMNKIRPE